MTAENIQRCKQAKLLIESEVPPKTQFALTWTLPSPFRHTSSQPDLQTATCTLLPITSLCSHVLCLHSLNKMPHFTFEVRERPGPYRLFAGMWQRSGIFLFPQYYKTFNCPSPSYFVAPSVISGISPYTSLATSNLVSFLLRISPTLQHLVCLWSTGWLISIH